MTTTGRSFNPGPPRTSPTPSREEAATGGPTPSPHFADAEQEEGDAWHNHMAVGGQIEEGLSWVVDLFSKAYHDASNVSVLFAYSWYYKYVFLTCFLPPFPCLQQLLSMSRDKNDRMARLHSRVHWLDSYNGTLVT